MLATMVMASPKVRSTPVHPLKGGELYGGIAKCSTLPYDHMKNMS